MNGRKGIPHICLYQIYSKSCESLNMMQILLTKYKILLQTVVIVILLVATKLFLHKLALEFITFSPLHASLVAGGIFILSIFMGGVMADYKEAERLPSEFTAIIDNMSDDATSIKSNYPEFNLNAFKKSLISTLETFRDDVTSNKRKAYQEIHEISDALVQMEKAKVPPNFIAKLKQEQGLLVKILLRVYYIQKIKFIPSGYYLVVTTSISVIGILLFTDTQPFNPSLVALSLIAFIFIYLVKLIGVISTPFRPKGSGHDDVSLFLVEEAIEHLKSHKTENNNKHHVNCPTKIGKGYGR